MNNKTEKDKCISNFFDTLGIYVHHKVIVAEDLYDILNDEEKLQALVSKLKLKAFW